VRSVEAGGIPFALREWGDVTSPPLLAWHGAGERSRFWEQPARVLAEEDGVRVIAPDAPGHGATPALPDRDYRPSRMAALAAALLDALAVDSCLFAGFSWGASVGCRLVAAYPQRVRALVLIDGGVVDFRDLPGFQPPAGLDAAVAQLGLAGAVQWGSVLEPTSDTYGALRAWGGPVLLITDGEWRLPFDPIARLREAVPQVDVHRVPAGGQDSVAQDPRNVARVGGDWLAGRNLI
jgi:pimeloyl-ACP methyl ester carboxylesterase